MNTSKKIISLLMCMLMVLTIVPMSVFATVLPIEIDTVNIEGVPAPVYGQTIKSYYEAIEAKITDGTITVNDEVYDSANNKYGNLLDDGWNVRDEDDFYLSSTSTDLIKEGTYYVAMWFLPDNGYVIPEDVNVLFDGAKSVEIEVEDDGCLDIHAEYEVKATEIDTVHVEGVPAPVYGQTIKSYYEAIEAKITDGTITVNDEVYDSANNKYGNLLDDAWNVRDEDDFYLSSTSTESIKEGTYYVTMWFLPDNGYVIPEDVNVIFDGAKSVKIELEDDGCLDIHAEYEVEAPTPTEIDTVHIEGIPAPVYGQTVKEYNTVMHNGSMVGTHKINGSTRVDIAEGIFYGNIELVEWDYYNSEKSSYLTFTEALPSVYYFVQWLNPVAEYKFADDVAVTVDGAVSVETEIDEDGWLTVWAKFEVKPTEIDTIHIEGIPAPVYGQTVEKYNDKMRENSTNGTNRINGNTRVDDENGNVFYGNIEVFDWDYSKSDKSGYLDFSETLPSVYYFVQWLKPAEGYEFADDVTVTVDGAVSVETELDEDGWLTVWAKFEVEAPIIDTIHIEGIPAPQYGQTVEEYNDAMCANSMNGTYKINGNTRVDVDYKVFYGNIKVFDWDYSKSDKSGYLDFSETLPSVYYFVEWLEPAEGYEFADDVNVTVDGAVSVETEFDEEHGYLWVWAKFEVPCPHSYDNACDAECNLCPETRTAPHTYESVITKATLTADGKIESKCSICGDVASSQTITKIGSVTLSQTEYVHDGKNKTPKVTVKDANGNTLVKNVDYKTSVASKRSGIGRYTVKVTFIGNYEGSKNVYFTILPGKPATIKAASQTTTSVKLSWSEVSGAAGYTVYRYSPSKSAYVKAGTTEGTSFTVKSLYSATEYTFKVVAYGKTSGGKVYDSESYALLKSGTMPAKPSSVKSASQTTSSIKLSWSAVTRATGYNVYRYSPSKKAYVKAGSTTGTSYTVKSLYDGTKYTFRVVPYFKTSDGTIIESSSYALLKTATKTTTPTLSKVASSSKGKATLTWSAVDGETGYTVYYSTKKDSGFKKYDNFKADSKTGTVSGLTSGKTYYFKVRTYITTDSGYVYSAWSVVKSVKVK